MLYLKIMSGEDLSDSDPSKNFTIISIPNGHRLLFTADKSYSSYDPHVVALIGPHAGVDTAGFEIPDNEKDVVVPLTGNAYVLSESGKTISKRSPY